MSDKHSKYFDSRYPLFFVNKGGSSVIDIALNKGLQHPITSLVNHIVKYQDGPASICLFRNNLVKLIS